MFGDADGLLLFVCDVDLHNVKGELVFDVLAYEVTVLAVAVAYAEVPQIFNLCEVLHHEEVVLVCLSSTVRSLAGPRQVCELSDLVVDLADLDRDLGRHNRPRLLTCLQLGVTVYLVLGWSVVGDSFEIRVTTRLFELIVAIGPRSQAVSQL